jgi:PEP-CTERM motif
MNHTFKSLIIAAGVVASIGSFSSNAAADPMLPFHIDPQVLALVPGNWPADVTAKEFTGKYAEQLTIIDAAGHFSVVAYYQIDAANNGGSNLNNTGINDSTGYNLYALFQATGVVTGTTATGFSFAADGGGVQLYVDKRSPLTGFPDPVNDPLLLTNNGDDILLGSANLLSGHGNTDPTDPNNNGSFGLTFYPFSLTATGGNYFTAPRPFYLTADLNGVFDPFANFSITPGSKFNNQGAGDAFFTSAVPEPASLTLLGLGLIGAAMRRRRNKANAA